MSTIEGSTVYRTVYQDREVSTIEGSTVYRTVYQDREVSTIEVLHCTILNETVISQEGSSNSDM